MNITRSHNPLARASATAISFKQMAIETAPAQRPEVIAVLANYNPLKTGIVDNIPWASNGTAEEALAKFGTSPMSYIADKLFPISLDGAKVPVLFVPIAQGGTATAATLKIDPSFDQDGFIHENVTISVAYKDLEVTGAADAVGKMATRYQLDPATPPRGLKLNGFGVNVLQINLSKGQSIVEIAQLIASEISNEIEFPYSAVESTGTVVLTAKWKGASAPEIFFVDDSGADLKVLPVDGGTLEVILEVAGTDDYDIEVALDNLVAEYGVTRLISQFDEDADLDLIKDWGIALRDALVSQYAIAYIGREYPESGTVAGTVDVTAVKAFGDGREEDPINSVIYGNYGNLREMLYTQRDTLVKSGITNIELRGSSYQLRDVVTFYHPQGVTDPIFGSDRDTTLAGNIAYDERVYFDRDEWQSRIIVEDSEKTNNPNAIDLADVAAAFDSRARLYEQSAWIASAAFAIENSVFAIDPANGNRINANPKFQISGTLRILDITNFIGRRTGTAV